MFGFISDIFSSKPSTHAVYRNDKSTSVSEDGLTGVAKYLNAHAATPRGPSSVDKYLSGRAQKSGVAKYVARQTIAAKEASKAKVAPKGTTGVAKYLVDNADAKPVKSGVSKYLSNRKVTAVSSVSKYMLKQALEAKNKPKPETVKNQATGVAQYLENKPVHITSGVAKYLAKQVIAAKQIAEEAAASAVEEIIEPVVALTGVEKYLSKQAA